MAEIRPEEQELRQGFVTPQGSWQTRSRQSRPGQESGALSTAQQNEVTIVSRRHAGEYRNPENCLDSGSRRYDERRLDTHLRGAVLNKEALP
jgi:hypothetical protein